MFVSLPRRQRGLHALRQGAGRWSFAELVLWSGQGSEYAHCKSTHIKMKCQPMCPLSHKHCRVTQSLESLYFSRGSRSSLRSQWWDDPSSPARFPPSQTGASNPQGETRDAPRPKQRGSRKHAKDQRSFSVLPHPLPCCLWRCLEQDRGELLKNNSVVLWWLSRAYYYIIQTFLVHSILTYTLHMHATHYCHFDFET